MAANAASSSSASATSQVIGTHFRVGKKIGEGSFGVIFEGINLINNIQVAIKFEPRKAEAPQLRDEYRTYKMLVGCPGIPQVYYYGQEGLHNILVIDLLGPSLEDLFDHCGRHFSIKSTVMIAKQMVDHLHFSFGPLIIANIRNRFHAFKLFTIKTTFTATSSLTTSSSVERIPNSLTWSMSSTSAWPKCTETQRPNSTSHIANEKLSPVLHGT